eukprot:TRINITY_DN11140_c0_g1_i1.p1 TRINITY_DN11140_c0_g1~~TRINITY_DN11140_c0_g1_i1.p1  ORF type:complete len:416 (-),score=102.84 TRINITY_DN11140_c0_g1_i1:67-1314(-)
MGVKQLMKVLSDNSPLSITETQLEEMFGRSLAIDVHVFLYQFIVAIRPDQRGETHLSANGVPTSHLNGLFYRTINMLQSGIKPIYCFDGEAPDLKQQELDKRKQRKQKATEELVEANANDDIEKIIKLNKITARVSPEMIEEAKELLRLMGVCVIESPGEAEAQCAELVKGGKAWAAVSEDMDTIAFGTPKLIKNLSYSKKKGKKPVIIELEKVLEEMNFTMDQFVDLCILLGTDFTDKIKGIGPKRAFEYITTYGDIETIIKKIDKNRYIVPDPYPYEAARNIFSNPNVIPADECDINFEAPNEEGLIKFMCEDRGFDTTRMQNGLAKIRKSRKKGVQSRITSFVTIETLSTPASRSPKKKKPAKKARRTTTTRATRSPAKTRPTLKRKRASSTTERRKVQNPKPIKRRKVELD